MSRTFGGGVSSSRQRPPVDPVKEGAVLFLFQDGPGPAAGPEALFLGKSLVGTPGQDAREPAGRLEGYFKGYAVMSE